MNRVVLRVLVVGLCLLISPAIAAAQARFWTTENDKEGVVRITIHPTAAPVPSLKYRLLPKFLDRLPGNAAVDYGKVTAEQMGVFGNQEWMKKNVHDRLEAPLKDLRGVDLNLPTVFDALQRAGRREYCDWQVPIRTEPFFSIVLPELQQTRDFARLLAVRARIEMADGQYDKAIHTLQSGYALARNVGRGPTIIHGLVGVAIAGVIDNCVLELAQQPGAPNLYWALTSAPQPLVDLSEAIDAEAGVMYLMWPELRNVADDNQGDEYWTRTLRKIGSAIRHFPDKPRDNQPDQGDAVSAVMLLKGYPLAKEALIAQGMPAEKIEAMPVAQVILLYWTQTYEEFRDDTFSWFHLPYWQAQEGIQRADQRLKAFRKEHEEAAPLAQMFIPAATGARAATARYEREIALLRLIEALRIYAAAHEGHLPEKLADVTEVPLPIDPCTGKPFDYRRDGDRAIIEGPPLRNMRLKLEIQMAAK